jgi:hypothetical protein
MCNEESKMEKDNIIGKCFDVLPFVGRQTDYNSIRNCRNCHASYTKEGFWCKISKANTEPVGFCDFCNRDSKLFYKDLKQKLWL